MDKFIYVGFYISIAVSCVEGTGQEKVCYNNVGCFDHSPPYDQLNLLPASPSDIGTQFFLYTPNDKVSNRTIDWNNMTSLMTSTFDVRLPVKIIIHGFANSNETEWLYEMKDELFKKNDMNVVIVTWGPGAVFPKYREAVANTRLVARQLAGLLDNISEMGVAYQDIHMIGHSLGAHICGHAGEIVKEKNHLLGRISGLDPAEPEFKDQSILVKLDPSDANFVDVIHTSGAPLKEGGFGFMAPCGHVDFFINGGVEQPDCSSLAKTFGPLLQNFVGKRLIFDSLVDQIADEIACSHGRAHYVYTESINMVNDCQFTAYPCKDYEDFQHGNCLTCGLTGCGVMGYMAEEYYARGNFYLNTRMSEPYCGHHYGVSLYMSEETNTVGELYLKLNSSWGTSEWMNVTGSTKTPFLGGHVVHRVAVSMDVIGRLHEVSLKFVQTHDHRNHGPLGVVKLSVVSGESGQGYLICADRNLTSGHTETFVTRPLSEGCAH